ncbi:zinc finger, GRF-type containing protein [Tanacetum coccineum]
MNKTTKIRAGLEEHLAPLERSAKIPNEDRDSLEAVIRTSWTNQNQGRHFYGCPTLETCVNFLRWFDPPMCQRSVQIILGLLRLCNELEEILAMVEEKLPKLMKFLIISWVGFVLYVYCTM